MFLKILADTYSYGFKLEELGCLKNKNDSDNILLNNTNFTTDSYQFIKINRQTNPIYIATHHHAACYFTFLEKLNLNITGSEQFVHVDSAKHPDNRPYQKELTTIEKISHINKVFQAKFAGEFGGYKLNVTNYLSCLLEYLPELDCLFLHDGSTYGCRNKGKPLEKDLAIWDYAIPENKEIILSIDLDFINKLTKAETALALQKLIELISKAKLTMFFTSPGYIQKEKATLFLQQILDEINPLFNN